MIRFVTTSGGGGIASFVASSTGFVGVCVSVGLLNKRKKNKKERIEMSQLGWNRTKKGENSE